MLVPVDGLREKEVEVVQRQGGDEGQHTVLMGNLHRDVDSGRKSAVRQQLTAPAAGGGAPCVTPRQHSIGRGSRGLGSIPTSAPSGEPPTPS